MKDYPKNVEMGDIEPSNKTLLNTKHTKSSIPNYYEVGLDSVTTPCLVSWIERTRNNLG